MYPILVGGLTHVKITLQKQFCGRLQRLLLLILEQQLRSKHEAENMEAGLPTLSPPSQFLLLTTSHEFAAFFQTRLYGNP